MRGSSGLALFGLGSTLMLSASAVVDPPADLASPQSPPRRLAVVVPAYRGDLERAVWSMERWPTSCSPVTQANVDLVLYYAEAEGSAAVDGAEQRISDTAGQCFSQTRTVYAHLDSEDDVYPKAPSAMFYKMFLDDDVRARLSEYDALALMEWDVLVASDRSFEKLYHAAFRGPRPEEEQEDFWVKGSVLGGTSFHDNIAEEAEAWGLLGHINGNAIYNNRDPAFKEYVAYTRTRWEYKHPYDVALWLTISDFPYSWPLYQRFSGKFVTTNLISYVGYESVSRETVSNAVAGQTLFIHGSNVEGGSRLAPIKADATEAGAASASTGVTTRTSRSRKLQKWRENQKFKTVQKWTIPPPKWQRQEKWKGNDENGVSPKWRPLEKWKGDPENGVPPKWQVPDLGGDGGVECEEKCYKPRPKKRTGRVCDPNCTANPKPYGRRGCNTKSGKYGRQCRKCYNDIDLARKKDTPRNRAIMCDTLLPYDVYARRLTEVAEVKSTPRRVAKMLDAMRTAQQTREEEEVEVMQVDTLGLTNEDEPTPAGIDDKTAAFFAEAADRPFTVDLTRGNLCAFLAVASGEVAMWEVTVKSFQQFVPGMRVAIAADAEGLEDYKRSVGGFPGVHLFETGNVRTSALFADHYCGDDTSLILYVKPGSVLSRPFTSKDTHSTAGDLLVLHSNARGSLHDAELSRRTAAVLGPGAPSDLPSFTYGTDLMLPAAINGDLRDLLWSEGSGAAADLVDLVDFDPVSAIPQALAALAYIRGTPGVWFVDPQQWVARNLFKEASIWEIPLVKPRYTCAIAPSVLEPSSPRTADVLQSNLDFFTRGGKCAHGAIDLAPSQAGN